MTDMKPEDFEIGYDYDGRTEINCPKYCLDGNVHGDTLGEALDAARRHITEKHAATASP